MMREAAYGIYGAWRLALFDRAGAACFERTPEGARRSFLAALLIAPAYLILLMLRVSERAEILPLTDLLIVESIAYVVNWTAFALAMYYIAGSLGRRDNYFAFLAAYNWSAVVQMAVYLPAAALAASGMVGPEIGNSLVMAVTMAVLVYQWFIASTMLEVPGVTAAGTVALDILLAVIVQLFVDQMV
jgi:hypothetical protein